MSSTSVNSNKATVAPRRPLDTLNGGSGSLLNRGQSKGKKSHKKSTLGAPNPSVLASNNRSGRRHPAAPLRGAPGGVSANASSKKWPSFKDENSGLYRYSGWQTGPPLHALPRPASFAPSSAGSSAATIPGRVDRVQSPPSPAVPSPRQVPLTAWVPEQPRWQSREERQRDLLEAECAAISIELVGLFSVKAMGRPLPGARQVFREYRNSSIVIWSLAAVHDLGKTTFSVNELDPRFLNDHWQKAMVMSPQEIAWVEHEQRELNALCFIPGRDHG